MKYKCGYCNTGHSSFDLEISHLTDQHHEKEIKLKVAEGRVLKTLNFRIIPDM